MRTLCLILCVCALGTAQTRSVTDGVYSAGQAGRGQDIYQSQCASCHGKALDGGSGPPLVGDGFLSNWSEHPLTNVVDKIQKTMPFNKPGSLSRQQSIDLAAYIFRSRRFPAGRADLNEEALGQAAFPPLQSVPRASAPIGNLDELMRAIAFPNANIIFNVQPKDPVTQPKGQPAASPFDYVEWGDTIYPGWLPIDQAALAITETAALLLTPGRRCQNGRPARMDRTDWKKYVSDLVEVGKLARRASQARNADAFIDISEKLNDACANCHKVYRDKGGTDGSGATRCRPPAEEK